MAAWTSLYDASRNNADDRPAAAAVPVAAPADSSTQEPIDDPGAILERVVGALEPCLQRIAAAGLLVEPAGLPEGTEVNG